MGEKTTVEIETETRRKLKVWKAKHDMTYDQAIRHLIREEVHILLTFPYDNDTGEETVIRGVFDSESAAQKYADSELLSRAQYDIQEYEVNP